MSSDAYGKSAEAPDKFNVPSNSNISPQNVAFIYGALGFQASLGKMPCKAISITDLLLIISVQD